MAWRKSWSKLNIYGKNGDGECSKRKLLPDERSVLDDYLDLAELSPIRGQVCIAQDIGYSQDQLSHILKTPIEIIKKTEIKLVRMDIVTIDDKRVVSIVNWKQYQSEYERQLPYRVTHKGYKKKLRSQSESDQNQSSKDKRVDLKQNLDCKTDLYKILNELPLKETDSLITLFCTGRKTRGLCYDKKKCLEPLRGIVDKTKKAGPDNCYGYVKVSIEKLLKGEGYKAK